MQKQLSDFRLVERAFQMILDDQPYPRCMRVRIVGETIIPKTWLKHFEIAETCLGRVEARLIKDCDIPTSEIYYELRRGDVKMSDSALEHVVLPINDLDATILASIGCSIHEIKTLSAVLYEFFDGDLRSIFQTGHEKVNRAARH